MEVECPEEFKCPICFEIPIDEIFQCKNGHTICKGCSSTLSECPQCREKYEKSKIRNRALESLIKTMKLHGEHDKSEKCDFTKSTKPRSTQKSSYSPNIKFCELLGYSCEFVLDTRRLLTALVHFTKCHDFILHKDTNINMHLEGILGFDQTRKSAWTPVVLDLTSKYGVILIIINIFNDEDKTFSLVSIKLSDNTSRSSLKDIRTEFIIKPSDSTQTPKVIWNAPPVKIRQAQMALKYPPFRIPINHLKNFYLKDGVVIINCSVSVSLGYQEAVEVENLHIFNLPNENDATKEASTSQHAKRRAPLPPPRQKSKYYGYVFQGISCDVCGEIPLKSVRYKCLQCLDYDLCRVCMEKGEHRSHLFAILKTEKQNEKLKEYIITPSGLKPFLSGPILLSESGASSSTMMSCPISDCSNFRSYICLQCRPVFGYCQDCFNKYSSSHAEGHIFAIANTERKLRLIFENLPGI